MNKHVKLILLVSVMLNIVLLGAFLGHLSHHMLWPDGFLHPSAGNMAKLPDDKRALLENTLRAAYQDADAIRQQMGDARKEANRILVTEPFDEQAYLTQVQRINDLRAMMKRHMAQSVVDLARQFNPQERAVLAGILSPPHEGGK